MRRFASTKRNGRLRRKRGARNSRHRLFLSRGGDKLRVDANALGLPGPFKNPLRLRLPESWTIPGIRAESIEMKDWVADASGLRNAVSDAQRKLRAEIESLQPTLDPKDAKLNA